MTSHQTFTVIEHLEELRRRLLVCLGFWAIGSLLGFFITPFLLDLLKAPLLELPVTLILTKPTEAVLIYFKITVYAGFIISSPLILHQLWLFIKPGIPGHVSVSFINWLLPAGALFAAGTACTYFFIVPAGLTFLIRLSGQIAQPMFTVNSYVSFILALELLGGIIFEMPILSALLTRIGFISPSFMRKKRKEAFLAMLVFAAILTPTTDVFNLGLFAVPMLVLYELSILTSQWVERTIKKDFSEEVYANG